MFRALVAATLLSVSGVAIAQSSAPLSVASSSSSGRVGADVQGESDLRDRRGIGIYIIGAIALGLIIWGIIELSGGDDRPSSP